MVYKSRIFERTIKEHEIDKILNEMETSGWKFVNGLTIPERSTHYVCLIFKK